MARRRKGIVIVWSTRRFQLVADRLGFTLAFGPLVADVPNDLFYHPRVVGYRKGLSGWRWIVR